MVTPNLDGLWKNELGSEMDLNIRGTEVVGTYKTGIGSMQAQKSLPLRGMVHYPLISFVVDYSTADTLCAWVGRFEDPAGDGSNLVLRSLWILASLYHGSEANP